MKTIAAHLACLAVLLLVLPSANADPVAEAEAKQLFAWFDSLGFPDLAKCKCVRVFTGIAIEDEAGNSKTNYTFWTFLVKDEKTSFTVFTEDLETISRKKTAPGVPAIERVGYEECPIEKGLAEYLIQRANGAKNPLKFRGLDPYLKDCLHFFVWARFCAAHGLSKRAHELLTRVEDGRLAGKTIQETLTHIIAYDEMYATEGCFAFPEISRKELRARYAWILKYLSSSYHAERAKASFDMLTKMVAEDEAHARKPLKPFDKMAKQEQIAELIFRLRDEQDGPGLFLFPAWLMKETARSPGWQLSEIGFEAVPQLIAALDDERFTRSFGGGFGRVSAGSNSRVLRIGDCAVVILERIAGRKFEDVRTPAFRNPKDERAATKWQVFQWFQAVQAKGLQFVLIEATEAGDENCVYQASQLVAKYPQSALAAIRKGAANSKNEHIRADLITLAAKHKDKEVHAFLLAELRGPRLHARAAAAKALLKRGDDAGTKAMLQEWSNPGDVALAKPSQAERRRILAGFLLSCGNLGIVNVLTRDWRQYPIADRYLILRFLFAPATPSWADEESTLPKEVVRAIDALLVAALDDEEQCEQAWQFTNVVTVDPRVCDYAAAVLAERRNLPNSFDHAAPVPTRDRQRLALKEMWLKKRGKEAPPKPPQK